MIYAVAAVLSLFLSFWISFHEAVINPDAICYLLSAELMGQSGISAGMHICPQANWPFYSFLILWFSKLTHLSLQVSAQCLDALFTVLSVTTFIAIIKRLGGSKKAMWLAAFVALFSHELMSVRQYIVRDHGFWAFYLVSIYFLMDFVQQPRLRRALGWSVAMAVATLFRIEGAIFFLTIPFAALFMSGTIKQRIGAFLTLYSPVLLLVGLLGIWLLLHPDQTLKEWGRLAEISDRSMAAVTKIAARFDGLKHALIDYILPGEATRDASLVLLLTMIVWYVVNIIQNLSWAAALLVLYAWYAGTAFARDKKIILLSYLTINLAVTSIFFAEHLFLSKRYLIALTLIFLLWVPFAIEILFSRTKGWSKKGVAYLLVGLLFIPSLGVVFQLGSNKAYIRDAGVWIAANVPVKASMYSNDYQLLYYSDHFGQQVYQVWRESRDVNPLASDKWKQYDYLVLRFGRHRQEKLEALFNKTGLTPIQVFENNRGEKILIVKTVEKKQ